MAEQYTPQLLILWGIIVMTSGIGIVGSTAPAVSVPVSSSGTAATFTVPQPVATTSSAAQTSPRGLLDPNAGYITQYLSANGSQVVSQTPTAITVAYMRLGLTADGLSKPASSSVGTSA